MPNILAWGVDALRPPENRPYDNNTGTGVLLGDRRALFFPGTINCEVVEHGDNALFLKLVAADLVTVDPTNDTSHAAIRPDFAAAEAAGLPAGAFGLLEINTTGRPSLSRVFPPAASNDVEIHLTAVPRPPGRGFLRGDCNADGTATGSVTDAVFMLLFNFSGGDRPSCLDACDANGDGRVLGEVTDAIYLLTFNFLGGPSPPPPFPGCGAGEETKLGCESYPPCEG
jgi:hypothetical protein